MTDACSNLTDACSELILLAPLLLLIILFFQAMNKSYLMCCWFERSLRLRVHFCVDQVLEKKKLQSQAKSQVASCCVRFLRENIAEMSFSITTWRAEKEICFLLYKVASSYFFLDFLQLQHGEFLGCQQCLWIATTLNFGYFFILNKNKILYCFFSL